MFNIQEFKSHLDEKGTLPTSRFSVEIPIPRVLINSQITHKNKTVDASSLDKTLSLRAESVRVPGATLQFSNINRYGIGPVQKFPYNANFTDMSISFIADRNSEVWLFFYSWLNNIFSYNNAEGGNEAEDLRYRSNYMVDYAVPLKIHVYDVDATNSATIELIDAYPISINDIPLAWGDLNQTMRITVSFAFRHWSMTDVNVPDRSSKIGSPAVLTIPPRGETVFSANVSGLLTNLNNSLVSTVQQITNLFK